MDENVYKMNLFAYYYQFLKILSIFIKLGLTLNIWN